MTAPEHFARRVLWAAGPLLLWAVYFFAAYVLVAVACRAVEGAAEPVASLRGWLLGMSLLALAIDAAWLALALRRCGAPAQRLTHAAAAGSALLSMIAIAWLAWPMLALPPCSAL